MRCCAAACDDLLTSILSNTRDPFLPFLALREILNQSIDYHLVIITKRKRRKRERASDDIRMATFETEVPLAYPCHTPAPARYVVHDVEGTISSSSATRRTSAIDPQHGNVPFYNLSDHLVGSASVSRIPAGQLLVTTSALPEEPQVLTVTFSHNHQVHSRIELDLQHAGMYGRQGTPTAKVQCFRDRLVLCDTKGIILTILLQASTLLPTSCSVVSIPDLLQSDDYAGAEVYGNMVAFGSPTCLFVALSPLLLAVNLETEEVVVWNQPQILQDLFRVGSILSRASDLFLGRNDETEDDDDDKLSPDMPAVSALCLCEDFLFTLHADASLRRWRLNPDDILRPSGVLPLYLSQDVKLPSALSWSETSSAVALAARLYENATYALALFVQTDEAPTLTVLHGDTDDAVQSTLSLDVPQEASALVGMNFKNDRRCCLTVACRDAKDASLLVTYPPSVVSIVSRQPVLTRSTLEQAARDERERLWNFTFLPSTSSSSIEQEMHRLDKLYLQRLFCPTFPRGNGSATAPLPETIRTALAKAVPGRRHQQRQGASIQLETLQALQDWRRHEQNRGGASSRPRTAASPGASIYEQYADLGESDDEENDDMMDEQDPQELEEEERQLHLAAHEQRWKKLLTAVYEEEQRLCQPLGWSFPVLVRSGVTSSFVESVERTASTSVDHLDETALAILEHVQGTEEPAKRLYAVEEKLSDMVARASLVLPSMGESEACSEELARLGDWALESGDAEGIPETLNQLSPAELTSWLNGRALSSVACRLSGLSTLASGTSNQTNNKIWGNASVNPHTRHAACTLYINSVNSVRSLQLGRCLLLLSVGKELKTDVAVTSFRAYLRSLSILWVCGQVVPMPNPTIDAQLKARQTTEIEGQDSSSTSPPVAKRLSFSDDEASILQPNSPGSPLVKSTTALDAHMIQLSHKKQDGGSLLLAGVSIQMARAAFFSTFTPFAPLGTLSELGALPEPSGKSVASDYPRLALRLLAPNLAYPTVDDSVHMTFLRKEAVAECLLIQASSMTQTTSLSNSMSDLLRKRACELLVGTSNAKLENVSHKLLEAAFGKLLQYGQKIRQHQQQQPSAFDDEDGLGEFLQVFMYGDSEFVFPNVERLARQPTARALFLPLRLGKQGDVPKVGTQAYQAIKCLAEILLRLSDLMCRLSILERHTAKIGANLMDDSSADADFLLSCIEATIDELSKLLPEKIYASMVEFSTLWSMMFSHAVSSGRWMKAFQACLKHPSQESRASNFSRFVTAMVDAGALGELIDLCSVLSSNSQGGEECVDLYEVVVETLSLERVSDTYSPIFSPKATGRETDYLGCLYAVHASRGEWKRAAQATDARYRNMAKSMADDIQDEALGPVDESAAMEEFVFTSFATLNAIQLIKDASCRSLVSGEVKQHPLSPFLDQSSMPPSGASAGSQMNKRERDKQNQAVMTPFRSYKETYRREDDGSRLSRFLTSDDMSCRAIRALAFRKIGLDGSKKSKPFSSLVASASSSVESDQTLISLLVSAGYFQLAIALSKAMSKSYEPYGSSRPMMFASVYQILDSVLPIIISRESYSLASSSERMDIENDRRRPTLSQMLVATDEIHGAVSCFASQTWESSTRLPAWTRSAAAMELVRNLTISYASPSNSIALDVAEFFLGQTSRLPTWAEDSLLGSTSGLFGRNVNGGLNSFGGDPSALLGLYMKKGLYNEACAIVSAVLLGEHKRGPSRKEQAPSRLPEKGDIDFVPYSKIDLLWNLIEQVLVGSLVDATTKVELKKSRNMMETALEEHFELMKIGELGLQSARRLRL